MPTDHLNPPEGQERAQQQTRLAPDANGGGTDQYQAPGKLSAQIDDQFVASLVQCDW